LLGGRGWTGFINDLERYPHCDWLKTSYSANKVTFCKYAVRPCLLSKYKVIICGFVENHGNPMLLSLQIMAMLTTKEMPCVENLPIAYCVNYRNTNIPGYCCQRSVFL